MAEPLEKIRADFDRIARLHADRPERADPYDAFVLSRIPVTCKSLLEIGCGAGRLARVCAQRGIEVTAIDASPEMIRLARERAGEDPRIRFVCADFLVHDFGAERFDCVLCVATLHHVPAATGLERMKALVNPGGTLVIHDVRAAAGPLDWLRSGLAAAATGDAWRWMLRHLRERGELRRAWHDHGAGERYPTMDEVRSLRGSHLPGAILHRHPLWRYTITWVGTSGGAEA